MAISWQTGEPPCGQELLIEFRCDGRPRAWRDLATKRGIQWYLSGGPCSGVIEILRWSTIDDDRSAMAMVALEKLLLSTPTPAVEIERIAGDWFVKAYDERLGSLAETGVSPSLIEAIEKLTEAGNGPESD